MPILFGFSVYILSILPGLYRMRYLQWRIAICHIVRIIVLNREFVFDKGGHHDAQKSRRIYFPLSIYVDKEVSFPSIVCKGKSIYGIPGSTFFSRSNMWETFFTAGFFLKEGAAWAISSRCSSGENKKLFCRNR